MMITARIRVEAGVEVEVGAGAGAGAGVEVLVKEEETGGITEGVRVRDVDTGERDIEEDMHRRKDIEAQAQ